MATKKEQQGIAGVEAEIRELESALQKLEESRCAREGQIQALESEQRGHIVAARVHKDAAAQKSIEQLAGTIAKLRADDLFDCDAISETSASLEAKKAELELLQWRARTGAVSRLFRERKSRGLEGRIKRQAAGLAEMLKEAASLDSEISAALRDLGGEFYGLAEAVASLKNRRPDFLAAKELKGVLESPLSSAYLETLARMDVEEEAERLFIRAQQELRADERQQEEPEAPPSQPGPTTVQIGEGARLPDIPARVTTAVGSR